MSRSAQSIESLRNAIYDIEKARKAQLASFVLFDMPDEAARLEGEWVLPTMIRQAVELADTVLDTRKKA